MEKTKINKKLKRIALKGLLNEKFDKFNTTTKIFVVLYKLLQILAILAPAAMMLLRLTGSQNYPIISLFIVSVVLYLGSTLCHTVALDSANIKYANRAEEYIIYDENGRLEYHYTDISQVSQNKKYKCIIPLKEVKEVKYDKKTRELFLKGNFKVIVYKGEEITDEKMISSMSMLNIFDKKLKDVLMSGIKNGNLK